MNRRRRLAAESRALGHRPARACAIAMVAAVIATSAPGSAAERRLPRGYRVIEARRIARGVQHLELAGPTQRIHVARLDGDAPFKLRPVIAGDVVNGKPGVERTSSMCVRVGCVVAVNGDFFALPGTPTGGVVIDREPVRSAPSDGRQLLIERDGSVGAGALQFEVVLISSDLKRLPLDGVNVTLPASGSVLYTPRYGHRTRKSKSVLEIALRIEGGGGRIRIGETVAARIVGSSSGGRVTIPRDGAVVAARGKDARHLRALLARMKAGSASNRVLIRVDAAPSVLESMGGRPILVRKGDNIVRTDLSAFARDRHPRTLVGRTRSGEVLLVAVDGRQPGYSRGMSLVEAADLMVSLGAVEAINVDGGGSTTFVVKGKVVNRPSDRAIRREGGAAIVAAPGRGDAVIGNTERPVAIALAVVPGESWPPTTRDSTSRDATELASLAGVRPLRLAPPTDRDPASNPDAALPAIVALARTGPTARELYIALAALLWGLVAARLSATFRRGPQGRQRATGDR